MRSRRSTKARPRDALALHQAEKWRDDLIAEDDALRPVAAATIPTPTRSSCAALIRQARKDVQPDTESISKGLAPRQGRAYREIFQLVRAQLSGEDARPEQDDGSYDPRQASTPCASASSRSATAPPAGVYEDKGLPALKDWLARRAEATRSPSKPA